MEELIKLIGGEGIFEIIDSEVARLYPELVTKNCYIVPSGEDSKTLSEAEKIAEVMLDNFCNRKTILVCVGGGVVGDLGGFVASIFMRGIDWIVAPTTLLACVDSSVGGKTAVNLHSYKNIIGAFHNPIKRVVCKEFLSSLNAREWRCGVGEIVKTALLDRQIFEFLGRNLDALMRREMAVTAKAIDMCAEFKKKIVAEDFTESGKRKILNAGHTIGHALEKLENHRLSHGEYVLWGLAAESYVFRNDMPKEYYGAICALVKKVISSELLEFDIDKIVDASMRDKKNESNKISLIAPVALGEVCERQLSSAVLKERLRGFMESRV